MTKQQLFQILFDQFLFLNENRDQLIAAATTGDEAAVVLDAWSQSNLNQMTMGNKILVQDTADVRRIAEEMATAQKQIASSLADLKQTGDLLGKVTGVINMISSAVQLGTQLVALA